MAWWELNDGHHAGEHPIDEISVQLKKWLEIREHPWSLYQFLQELLLTMKSFTQKKQIPFPQSQVIAGFNDHKLTISTRFEQFEYSPDPKWEQMMIRLDEIYQAKWNRSPQAQEIIATLSYATESLQKELFTDLDLDQELQYLAIA